SVAEVSLLNKRLKMFIAPGAQLNHSFPRRSAHTRDYRISSLKDQCNGKLLAGDFRQACEPLRDPYHAGITKPDRTNSESQPLLLALVLVFPIACSTIATVA